MHPRYVRCLAVRPKVCASLVVVQASEQRIGASEEVTIQEAVQRNRDHAVGSGYGFGVPLRGDALHEPILRAGGGSVGQPATLGVAILTAVLDAIRSTVGEPAPPPAT